MAPAWDVASVGVHRSWSQARAWRGQEPGSGRRSSPANAGGVKNLRNREEGDAGRNLRRAPRWCSDEPRRAAAAALRSDHGADGGSNTVRVDGI